MATWLSIKMLELRSELLPYPSEKKVSASPVLPPGILYPLQLDSTVCIQENSRIDPTNHLRSVGEEYSAMALQYDVGFPLYPKVSSKRSQTEGQWSKIQMHDQICHYWADLVASISSEKNGSFSVPWEYTVYSTLKTGTTDFRNLVRHETNNSDNKDWERKMFFFLFTLVCNSMKNFDRAEHLMVIG